MRKLFKRLGYAFLILLVLLNIMAAFHAYHFTKFYERDKNTARFEAEKASFFEKAKGALFGVRSYRQRIDSVPSLFEKIIITTEDSLKLEAWRSINVSDSQRMKGTVIMFHGHGGNKAGMLKEANAFIAMKYAVFMVDFRAHGNSEGTVCTIGYNEAKDVKAAYEYIRTGKETNIVLWGTSLGAAAEMKAVNDYQIKPSAMILEMPFGSLHEAVKARCRLMGVPQQPVSMLLTFWGGVERGFWAFDHNPVDYAKNINCPVLLKWGANDNRVTRKETETIFQNFASSNKAFIEYSKSGHQSFCVNEKDKWINTVSAFLKRLPLSN